jgi:hypothetical protein
MTTISLPSRAPATSVLASGSGVAACQPGPDAADAEAASAKTASAGERTRTSKGFRPTGPKPVAFANSATPAFSRIGRVRRGAGLCSAPLTTNQGRPIRSVSRTRWLQSRARGNENGVTDEQDRERESRLSDENKFVELQEEVADETRRAAERLATDPVVNEPPADE